MADDIALFVADHLGRCRLSSDLFEPIHIGQALSDAKTDAEGDAGYDGSLSHLVSYADMRCLHHVWRRKAGQHAIIGLQQYRRLFLFPQHVGQHSETTRRILNSAKRLNHYQYWVDEQDFEAYVAYCETIRPEDIKGLLANHDIIVNQGQFFRSLSIEEQYLESINEAYPDDGRYIDAWFDFKQVLQSKLGEAFVDDALNDTVGHFNNVFIARSELAYEYATLAFEIFAALDQWKDLFRIYGYLAERLFTVFVKYKQVKDAAFRILELPILCANDKIIQPSYPRSFMEKGQLHFVDETNRLTFAAPLKGNPTGVHLSSNIACLKGVGRGIDPFPLAITLEGTLARQIQISVWSNTPSPVTLLIRDKVTDIVWLCRLLPHQRRLLSLNLDPGQQMEFGLRPESLKDDSLEDQLHDKEARILFDMVRMVHPRSFGPGVTIATHQNWTSSGYLAANPDLAGAGQPLDTIDPEAHFKQFGVFVGRKVAIPSDDD
ncbi:DUF4422 domain-containing protein [Cohaesibacter intestini]|uniref:DUF4422 domain-containing protein n=1 Tax=Cohaesibacter intestini TaxID=2211145 RepID=UPI000DE807F4